MGKALIISDQKKGHLHQSIALCKYLDLEFEIVTIQYHSFLWRLFSYLLDWFFISTELPFWHSKIPKNEKLELLVCCGFKTYYPAKVIAKKLKLPSVALMYPRGYRSTFDWIICPEHDSPPKKANTHTLPIAPIYFSNKQTEDAVAAFKKMRPNEKESFGFLIGGGCLDTPFDLEKLQVQLENLFDQKGDREFWVTTSPRTSPKVETLLKSFPFDYSLYYSQSSFNPLPAFLNLCSRVFCTEDSVSMISACVSNGKAHIEILESLKRRRKKIDLFISKLEKKALVHRYNGKLGTANTKIEVKSEIKAFMQK
jgi:uncharacterized protein